MAKQVSSFAQSKMSIGKKVGLTSLIVVGASAGIIGIGYSTDKDFRSLVDSNVQSIRKGVGIDGKPIVLRDSITIAKPKPPTGSNDE